MLRRLLGAAGGLLVLFHAWLFAGQAWNGALADPGLAARWGIAGLLLAGLAGLHRRGVSVIRGRRAIAIWLLAALLHAPAVAEHVGPGPAPALPEVVTGLVSAAAAGVLALGLALAAGLFSRRRPVRLHARRLTALGAFVGVAAPDTVPIWAPRPPPLA